MHPTHGHLLFLEDEVVDLITNLLRNPVKVTGLFGLADAWTREQLRDGVVGLGDVGERDHIGDGVVRRHGRL